MLHYLIKVISVKGLFEMKYWYKCKDLGYTLLKFLKLVYNVIQQSNVILILEHCFILTLGQITTVVPNLKKIMI